MIRQFENLQFDNKSNLGIIQITGRRCTHSGPPVKLRFTALYTFPPLYTQKPAARRVFVFSVDGLRCPAFASGVAAPSQKTDRCPCSASAVSAAGSASAAQPAAHLMYPPACGRAPRGGSKRETAPSAESIQQKEPFCLPYHYLAATHGRTLGSPRGRAGAKRLRGEAPPRAGELAQGAQAPCD